MHRKKGGMKYASEARKQDVAKPREKKKHAGLFATGTKKYFQYVITVVNSFFQLKAPCTSIQLH